MRRLSVDLGCGKMWEVSAENRYFYLRELWRRRKMAKNFGDVEWGIYRENGEGCYKNASVSPERAIACGASYCRRR